MNRAVRGEASSRLLPAAVSVRAGSVAEKLVCHKKHCDHFFAAIQRIPADASEVEMFRIMADSFAQRPRQEARAVHPSIQQSNKDPKPLKWKYADPTRRITASSSD
jgi:hypothetical protein